MFLGCIASTGEVSPPIWFPQGFRLNAEEYIGVLRSTILPWLAEVSAKHNQPVVLQQDSAPAHAARRTQDFLREENVEFWPHSEWPPNSPDLNPLDYAMWPYIEQKACRVRAKNLRGLKQNVSAAWKRSPESKI